MDSVFESIFGDINAFVYRCRNDKDYTMEYMSGAVQTLTGRAEQDIVQNAKCSFVDLTLEEDREQMFADVDAAIEAKRPWNVTYRFVHPGGCNKWVRERGSAVYVDGQLAFLQGMIVGAGTEFGLRRQLQERVEGTQQASAQIVGLTEQITSSVRELAMLSVNARIEAARSGEAGRGFAVVANEIKTLADRNAGFAELIAGQVQDMNNVWQ